MAQVIAELAERIGPGRVARIAGIPRTQVERIVRAVEEQRPLGGIIRSERTLDRYKAGLEHLVLQTETGRKARVEVPWIPTTTYPPEARRAVAPDVLHQIEPPKTPEQVKQLPAMRPRPQRFVDAQEAYRYARDVVRSGATGRRVIPVYDPKTRTWTVWVSDEETPKLRRRRGR